jgi:hypothetical protein
MRAYQRGCPKSSVEIDRIDCRTDLKGRIDAAGPERAKREAPAVGLGGLRLGLLIFETKTHPVTTSTTIDQ